MFEYIYIFNFSYELASYTLYFKVELVFSRVSIVITQSNRKKKIRKLDDLS